jgi:hypothetical protein
LNHCAAIQPLFAIIEEGFKGVKPLLEGAILAAAAASCGKIELF